MGWENSFDAAIKKAKSTRSVPAAVEAPANTYGWENSFDVAIQKYKNPSAYVEQPVTRKSSGVSRSWEEAPALTATRSKEDQSGHEQRQRVINDPNAAGLLKLWLKGVDAFAESPFGAWNSRAGEAANSVAFFDETPPQTSTGSKLGDITADAIGSLLGFVNPMGGGSGMHGASSLVGLGVGKSAPLAVRASANAAKGLVGGATYGATGGVVQDQPLDEILRRATREGLTFAGLGAGSSLGKLGGAATGAGMFGGMTAAEGGSPQDVATQTVLGLLLGGLGGQKRSQPSKPQFTEAYNESPTPILRLGSGQKTGSKVHPNWQLTSGKQEPFGLLNEGTRPDFYAGESGLSPDITAAGRLGLPSGNAKIAGLLSERDKPDLYATKNGQVSPELKPLEPYTKANRNPGFSQAANTTQVKAEQELNNVLHQIPQDVLEPVAASRQQLENAAFEALGRQVPRQEIRQLSYSELADIVPNPPAKDNYQKVVDYARANLGVDLSTMMDAAAKERRIGDMPQIKGSPYLEGYGLKAGEVERVSKLDEIERAARQRIEDRKGRLMSGIPVDTLADYTIIGATKIAKGAIKFADWSTAMVKEFGENIRPHLEKLWKSAKSVYQEQAKTGRVIDREEVAKRFYSKEKASEGVSPENWKDKSKIMMKRETMKRILEDVAGKDAPEMIRRYIQPIEKAEANRMRWLNKERKEISTLDIKGKSKQSELVQKYGEGQYTVKENSGEYRTYKYTLEDLKRDAPHDWEKIKKASETLRNKYDRYLAEVNKVLVSSGYDPIPKRDDYFVHFQEVTNLFEKVGIPTKDNLLPTDINGLTDNFKPGKNFFANALKRKGNTTTLDAIQGIDRYLEGISKLIHHTDNIQRFRGLERSLRGEYAGSDHLTNFAAEVGEYTNILAGKKARFDRATEDFFGRQIFSAADAIRKQAGANMIGANVGSAMTSFIPLTQSAATTGKKAFTKGMLDSMGNIFKDDGFIDRSDFLTRRMGSDRLVVNAWDRIAEKGFWLFKVIDNFTAQTVVRSKYLEGLEKGLNPKEAMKKADDWAGRMMADRSLGSMPTGFEAKTLKPLTQFQLEVNNQLSFLFKDIPRNFDKRAAASAIAQMVVYGYLFNTIYEKVVGRRPAFDPIYVLSKAYQDYTNPDKSVTDANKTTIRNIADQLPFVGIATGGRIPLESALPDVVGLATGETTWGKEAKKVASGLVLPTGGGQIKKTYEGYKAMKEGAVHQGDKTLYPVSTDAANILKALVFGKSSLPETKEYYDKNRRPLGAEQARVIQFLLNKGKDAKPAYERIQKTRGIDALKKEINKIAADRNLSQEEKKAEIKKLVERIRAKVKEK